MSSLGSCERENANGRFGNLIYFTYSLYFSIASSNPPSLSYGYNYITYSMYEKKQKQKQKKGVDDLLYHY